MNAEEEMVAVLRERLVQQLERIVVTDGTFLPREQARLVASDPFVVKQLRERARGLREQVGDGRVPDLLRDVGS